MKQETLYITKNVPFFKDIVVKDSSGTVINLTGYTASMYISKYFDSSTVFSVNAAIFSPSQGIVRASINAAGTGLIPAGTMQYSIFLTPTGQEPNLLLQGQVIVIPTVKP